MKLLSSTLKMHISTWDDPGDYPNSLAAGPLPSQDFVEEVTGDVLIQIEPEDISNLEGDTSIAAVRDYLADNARSVPHEEPGLVVKSWDVKNVVDDVVTLQVLDFETDVPERGYE